MLYDENGKKHFTEEGYVISIGGSQPDKRSHELTGKEIKTLDI
jgi:hypothetical protein